MAFRWLVVSSLVVAVLSVDARAQPQPAYSCYGDQGLWDKQPRASTLPVTTRQVRVASAVASQRVPALA